MTNTDIKRITKATIKDVEVNAHPELLFEAVDLVKTICEKTKTDYTVLLKIMGIDDGKPSKAEAGKEQLIGEIITKFCAFFYEEYDREKREPGKHHKNLLEILVEATDIAFEILRKTDYRILLQILVKFIQDPGQEMTASFLGGNPST